MQYFFDELVDKLADTWSKGVSIEQTGKLPEVISAIKAIAENGGVLPAKQVANICQQLTIDVESLMVMLLPLAARYSVAPISKFNVGAIALGKKSDAGFSSLYFGANIEYKGLTLCYSVHAEQAAVSNAWNHGELGLRALATSAAPCGHCRQFLHETSGDNELPIIMPSQEKIHDGSVNQSDIQKNYDSLALSYLLPNAFGPKDLGCDQLLMQLNEPSNDPRLQIISDNQQAILTDPIIQAALRAANLSYAPYTANFVGCAIETKTGKIYSGRYAENVAHNPSMSAFSSALSQMILGDCQLDSTQINRVVVVESSVQSKQKETIELLLNSLNCDTSLEYFVAERCLLS